MNKRVGLRVSCTRQMEICEVIFLPEKDIEQSANAYSKKKTPEMIFFLLQT